MKNTELNGCALTLCCSPENDLACVLAENEIAFSLCADAGETIRTAPVGSGVMLLADDYPDRTLALSTDLLAEAARRRLRLYIEYPSMLPNVEVGAPRQHKKGPYGSNLDREVIVSEAFGPGLRPMRIVLVHGCHYVPVKVAKAHIVTARVSGYDTALFGLPEDETWPILFEHPDGSLLVATTKLSHFVTGRYAPADAWPPIWRMILAWLCPGREPVVPRFTPTARPTYARADELDTQAEQTAMRRGAHWFGASGLFLDTSGHEGFYEGFSSKEMYLNGTQEVSRTIRADCHGEVSMALALGGHLLGDEALKQVAVNLNDLVYCVSPAAKGPRLDPASPSYGLIGGNLATEASEVSYDLVKTDGEKKSDPAVYYGDDFARRMLGSMASSAVLGTNRWDERMLMDILANFRTTGPWGFRKARLEEWEIQEQGWKALWESSDGRWHYPSPCIPHYQAYPWAVYLWLYDKTGFEPLLARTERGIRNLMQAYPADWGSEGNRHEQERCRMLLPLSWLLRVDDTPEHREWFELVVADVLAAQHASGAIRHRVLEETTSNAEYGTGECALLQSNGDPVTDLLYATNFAFLGLHEAAAVSGDPAIQQAVDRLADFLTRIQIKSPTHTELDGAWYRGFDFKRWDYWGSDGDIGWGVWTIETGWTVGWITATLALRQMKTDLWALTADSRIATHMAKHRPVMLPDEVLNTPLRSLT